MKNTLVSALVVLAGCGVDGNAAAVGGASDVTTTQLGLSWEDFSATTFKEPDVEGAFIVDGDLAMANIEELKAFHQKYIAKGNLIINRIASGDDRWSDSRKLNLTYCVSNRFGANKAAVVSAMAALLSTTQRRIPLVLLAILKLSLMSTQ
jgi:serine protease